jgi:hypothetical protein
MEHETGRNQLKQECICSEAGPVDHEITADEGKRRDD